MSDEAESLAFRARALAQAHPLSAPAARYARAVVEEERLIQPLPEAGLWAMAALTNGYCLRRVVEQEARPTGDAHSGLRPWPGREEIEARASAVAAGLRRGDGDEVVVEALERIIASEVRRRLNRWRDEVDEQAWAELGEYIAWWVVKGYSLRAAEEPG